MKTLLTVVALAVAFAQPAAAVTFPSLTTIYVGSGVRDDGAANTGVATSFNCSNVSGVSAQVRFLVLSHLGQVKASQTTTILHGETRTASTHDEATFDEDFILATGAVGQGVINVESTQSGVFCNATITNGAVGGNGIDLNMVRVNPHPGTVE